MSPILFTRGKAERFAKIVEEMTGEQGSPVRSMGPRRVEDNELRALATVARRVTDLPMTVHAHPEFRDGLRAMLMATVERDGIGATAKEDPDAEASGAGSSWVAGITSGVTSVLDRQRRARRRARLAGGAVAALAAGALAFSGMTAASGTALPGSPLYKVKRNTERAQLALSGSDISRAQLFLEFAKTRADEARSVRGDTGQFSSVLDDMDSETLRGIVLLTGIAAQEHDKAALDVIASFIPEQRKLLEKLLPEVTGEERARLQESLNLLDQINVRGVELRGQLGCPTLTTTGKDRFGPRPNCTNAPADKNGQPTTPAKPSATKETKPAGGHTDGTGQSGAGSQGNSNQGTSTATATPQSTGSTTAPGTAEPQKLDNNTTAQTADPA